MKGSIATWLLCVIISTNITHTHSSSTFSTYEANETSILVTKLYSSTEHSTEELEEKTTVTSPLAKDDLCKETMPCNEQDVDPLFCHCDDRCEEYNDCCLGYNQKHSSKVLRNVKCLGINNERNTMLGFFVVNECPETYHNKTLTEKCQQENMAENGLPVVDLDDMEMIYNNEFCAFCHNVTRTLSLDILFYDFKGINDKTFADFKKLSRTDQYRYSLRQASYQFKPSANTKVRSCVVDPIENNDYLCKQYMNPVVVFIPFHNLYRNSFCIPDETQSTNIRCLGDPDLDIGFQVDAIYSLSVFFSFQADKFEDEETLDCEIWTEQIAKNPACSQLLSYTNIDLKITYYLVSDVNLTFEDMKKFSILSAWSFVVEHFSMLTNKIIIETNDDNSIARLSISVKVLKRCFLHEASVIETSFRQRNIGIIAENNTTNQWIHLTSMQQLPNELPNKTVTFSNRYRMYVMLHLFMQKARFLIHFRNHSIEKLTENLRITVTKGSDNMLSIEFVNYLIEPLTTMLNTLLPTITYICFTISSVSLIFLLIYIRKHRQVSSIAGSNLENLSVSLLLASLLFMIGIGAYKDSRVCYAIGITLHYLWLTVFSFMTISVIYIVKHIVQIKQNTGRNSNELTCKRRAVTVVGLLLPLIFVGPAIVVDRTSPDYWSPGYGGKVCFPNQYPANVIFFSGPVIVSLMVNFVCLLTIIIKICKVKTSVRHIRKSETYMDAKMYLRLVVMSGIFWTSGLLAGLYELKEFEFMFIVLCGLQGLWVATANLTTSSVKCCKKPTVYT